MSSSKREEERNEKIIRGLMKLPPNRRCINCNGLGPQYVCSNFWTFVCMICSGIHREFTHRVKSVSMSKFTSQEVESLQNGGNQRARETYLKDWDMQRQRLPNSSDVDKVRDFIKAVYVDRKYAGGNKSEKPLKDLQTERNTVDDSRRASSYHSYSQSPPYDFQYEDRLNRKQGISLSRKPGSDRGLYDRKAASFVYSPGRFSDRLSEDRFANEGSSSRVSDYSMSSGGDPFRSAPQSPNLRDDELLSPTFYTSGEVIDGLQHQTSNSNSEVFAKKDADKIPVPRPQRTVSWADFGSFDKNSESHQPVGPASVLGVSAELHQSVVSTHNKISSFAPHSQIPAESSGGLNHFEDPAPLRSAKGVDLFQAPTGSVASVDFFESRGDSSGLSQTSPLSSSNYSSEAPQKPSATNLNPELAEQSEAANGGWATFDSPIKSATSPLHTEASEAHAEVGNSFEKVGSVSSSNFGLQWLNSESTPVEGPASLVYNLWTEASQNSHVATNMASSQPWDAFGEANEQQQQQVGVHEKNFQVSVDDSSSALNLFQDMKHAEDSTTEGLQNVASSEGFSFPNLSSHFASEFSFNQPMYPFMNDVANMEQKSSNPFDIPFDSEFEVSNAFFDMSSLQAALPSTTLPSVYPVGQNDSWFSPNPMGSQGGISYVVPQPQSSQLSNVSNQEPVASVGGNPFA